MNSCDDWVIDLRVGSRVMNDISQLTYEIIDIDKSVFHLQSLSGMYRQFLGEYDLRRNYSPVLSDHSVPDWVEKLRPGDKFFDPHERPLEFVKLEDDCVYYKVSTNAIAHMSKLLILENCKPGSSNLMPEPEVNQTKVEDKHEIIRGVVLGGIYMLKDSTGDSIVRVEEFEVPRAGRAQIRVSSMGSGAWEKHTTPAFLEKYVFINLPPKTI